MAVRRNERAVPEDPTFEVVDGVAVAEQPQTMEGLLLLGERLRAAGFTEAEVDGEEWSFFDWGLSPEQMYDHPFRDEVASGWQGGGDTPMDNLYSVHRIGDHWFLFDEFDVEELGEHADLVSAVAASDVVEVSPGGTLRVSRHGDALIELLDELGIEVDDPDEYEQLSELGVPLLRAVAECELLMTHAGDFFEALDTAGRLALDSDDVEALTELDERLPIAGEALENTIRWSSMDATERGITLAEALEDRVVVGEHWDDWEAAYARTVVEIEQEGGWEPAVGVAASRGLVLAVITACNPMSQSLSEEVNAQRNRALEAELHRPKRAVGRSPDGTWEEASFAVEFDVNVVEIARSWGQAAIFRVTPEAVEVVRLVG